MGNSVFGWFYLIRLLLEYIYACIRYHASFRTTAALAVTPWVWNIAPSTIHRPCCPIKVLNHLLCCFQCTKFYNWSEIQLVSEHICIQPGHYVGDAPDFGSALICNLVVFLHISPSSHEVKHRYQLTPMNQIWYLFAKRNVELYSCKFTQSPHKQ